MHRLIAHTRSWVHGVIHPITNHALFGHFQRVQRLKDQLSKATEASGEACVKLQEKQQEFVETVKRLKETDSVRAEAQESLEREQAWCTELEGKEKTAILNLNKVRKRAALIYQGSVYEGGIVSCVRI